MGLGELGFPKKSVFGQKAIFSKNFKILDKNFENLELKNFGQKFAKNF